MATVLTPERIKELIQEWIVPNGEEEIRADMFNTILSAIMSYVGVGYACKGVAPQYAPSSEVPVLYIGGPGTYKAYYNEDVVVPQGSIIIWTNDLEGAWSHTILDVATSIVAAEVQRATGKEGQMQEQIDANAEGLAAEVQRATGKEGQMQEQIDANAEGLAAEVQRAQAAESRLQDIYEGLTQNPVVVGPLPSSGQADTIYRVPGTSSYADYMWDGTQFVLMATFTAGHVALINVNVLNHDQGTPHAAYASVAAARADITAASGLRALGLQITYLLTDGVWYTDQYIGTDISGWSTPSNWKTLGPVTVTQNTLTKLTEIAIGEEKTEVENPETVNTKLLEETGISIKGLQPASPLSFVQGVKADMRANETYVIQCLSGIITATRIKAADFTPETFETFLQAGQIAEITPTINSVKVEFYVTQADTSIYISRKQAQINKWGGLLNINKINNKDSAYDSQFQARSATPIDKRYPGLTITYLLADGWHTEQFTGEQISPWGSATTWKGIDILVIKNEKESLTDWQPNTTYVVGDKRQVNGANWECIEAHTSLSEWGVVEWTYWKSYNNSGNDIIRDVNGVLSKECGADKLIELKSIVGNAFSTVEIGDVFYHSDKKQLRRKISNSNVELIPFYQGAIYTYNGKLYIWNGTDLVSVSKAEVIDNPEYKEVYVDLLNRVVFGLTTDGETYIPQEVVTKSEESVESEGIEPYFEDELEDTISSVLALRTEPCLVFPVITDVHYRFPDINPLYFKHGIENIKAFLKEVKCDFIVNLGDSSDGRAPKTMQIEWSTEQAREYAKLDLPMFFVPGNHELNIYTWPNFYDGSEPLTEEEIYTLYYNCMPSDVIHNPLHYHDYYKDFDSFNLRIVGLDFSNGSAYKIGDDTVSWARDVAFDTDKMVLLFTHYCCIPNHNAYPTVYTDANYAALTTVIENFISGGGTVVNITGHSHSDFSFVTPWLQISLNNQRCQKADINAEAYDYLRANTDIESPNRIYGAESEDCWSVFVLRPFSRKIDYIRFGAGNNKSFTY